MSRNTHRPEMHRRVAWKQPVRVATTASGTLATSFENGDSIDGVTLATGDRILIKDQGSAENGIYVVAASGAPARAFDMDDASEVVGAKVYVIAGTANGGKTFHNTNTTTPTLGVTTLTFAEDGAAGVTYATTAELADVAATENAGASTTVPRGDHVHALASTLRSGALEVVIDGGGSAITTGVKGDIEMPFAGTFTAWRLFADQGGAIVIDVWKDTYANFPPDNADAMPGAGKEPTIPATNSKAEDTTITDWTAYTFSAGDVLRFNVDSATTITRVTLSLTFTRT